MKDIPLLGLGGPGTRPTSIESYLNDATFRYDIEENSPLAGLKGFWVDVEVSPIGKGQGIPHSIHCSFAPLRSQRHPLHLVLGQENRATTYRPLSNQIMFVRAVLPPMRSHIITPLSVFQTRQVLTNFTTSKRISNDSSMQPKLSEGQDESRVMAEAKALLENGWTLDDEEVGVKKTYHFKTYTKALVFGVS